MPHGPTRPRASFSTLAAIAVGVALTGTAALVIGSPPKPSSSNASVECPTPDAAKCVEDGYIDSKCGLQHVAVCKQPVTDALESHYKAAKAPMVTMLAPGKRELPTDLAQGKYFAYTPTKTLSKTHSDLAKVYRKVGDPLLAHLGMSTAKLVPVDRLGHVDPATAAAYHREPSWDQNGDTVASCAEYAYERSYDVSRFIDAATACRGDRECVFDVAYMPSTPGIAKRKLHDTSGAELTKIPLATGTFPKNDLFVLGDRFVGANGTQPKILDQTATDLAAALRQGETWYQLGGCTNNCSTRKFKDEWSWHEHLHQVTANTSDAEREEYEARRAEFRELLEQWAAAVDKEHSALMQRAVNEIVLPFDMRAQNPFDRFEIERDFIERSNDQLQQIQQKFGNEILDKNLQGAVEQVVGARSRGSVFAVGVLAAPTPKAASDDGPFADSDAPKPTAKPKPKVSPCLRADGWALEMNGKGRISCRIGEFLRHEWERKLAGHRSCLDLGNPDCDWTLDMFEASLLDSVPLLDRQLADERYCKAWQDGATFTAPGVVEVRDRLTGNEAAFAETWPLVKEYDRGTTSDGRKFGKDWAGGDYLGDKGWFAVGYDFDLGWDVASLGKNGDGLVCELGGSIHAHTGFDAWIVGGKVEVVDGAVRAESNYAGNNKVRYNAHLEMFDQSVFSTANEPDDWKVAQSFTTDPGFGFGVSLPKPKPRFDIYVGVPVSGELWGELLFGTTLTMSGKASSSCNASDPSFAIKAGYMPFFGAYGVGQVGVGISGIVSAGIRASLTLITVGIPVELGMSAKTKSGKQVLAFDSQLSLTLATLAGRVSLYLEFLMFDEEWELFRWSGLGPFTAPLMPKLGVEVPLAGMK